MKRLTSEQEWKAMYEGRSQSQRTLKVRGVRGRSNRLILAKLVSIGLHNKRILEIGAGDSQWLTHLARAYPSSTYVGLDYSDIGCDLLRKRALDEGVFVEVVKEDLFVERSPLHHSFDAVISFGVVEHFDDLASVLRAISQYVRAGGLLFTLIPNMAGLVGALTRFWNREVYERHYAHDLDSFLRGHKQAGLRVIEGSYLVSQNFGVLSSCFSSRRGLSWHVYRGLLAASLTVGFFEEHIGNLPTSRWFSPYIYALSSPHAA